MSDRDAKRRITFAFLAEVVQTFEERFGAHMHQANAYGMNADFAPALQELMVSDEADTADGAELTAFCETFDGSDPVRALLSFCCLSFPPPCTAKIQRPLARQNRRSAPKGGRREEHHD